MSHEGVLLSPEPSYKGGLIVDEKKYKGKRLGQLSDLRQIGQHLVARGEGGQTYRQADDGTWVAIDLGFLDDRIDSNWAFAIQAQGSTGGEKAAYSAAHPDLKAEQERRIQLYISNKDLHSINGSNLNSLYVSRSKGIVYL